MPPSFRRRGHRCGRGDRRRHPGTGVVVLSQFDEPGVRGLAAGRGLRGLRLPAQGPGRGGQPAGGRDPGRSHSGAPRWTRPSWPRWSSRSSRQAGWPPRRNCSPDGGRGRPTSRPSPRPAAWQAEAVDAEVEAVFVKLAAGGLGRPAGRPPAAPAAAPGDRGPRGAGRRRSPGCCPAAWRRSYGTGGPADRRDRAGRGDRPDERHQVVLVHRRARRSQPAGPPARTRTGRR